MTIELQQMHVTKLLMRKRWTSGMICHDIEAHTTELLCRETRLL